MNHQPFGKSPLFVIMAASRNDEAIGHKFPKIFDVKIFHLVFVLKAIELAVATITGHYDHLCTGGFDLFKLFLTVIQSFLVISCR